MSSDIETLLALSYHHGSIDRSIERRECLSQRPYSIPGRSPGSCLLWVAGVFVSCVSCTFQAKEWEKQQRRLVALKKGGQSKGKAEDTVREGKQTTKDTALYPSSFNAILSRRDPRLKSLFLLKCA